MLRVEDTVLMVIDIQGKLAHLMHERDELFKNVSRLIRGAKVLDLPVVWTEQYPQGLGPTIPEVAELLEGLHPLPKVSFSCCGEERITAALESKGRRQVLLSGIEAHVCVYQTALDLICRGYEVHVVADAVSSRRPDNRELGLRRMAEAGALMTSVEMALFELLRVASGEKFREIIKIVR